MLELEVNPGHSLGTSKWQFVLGMHFSHAVAILQQYTSTIRGINVLFNQANPLKSDLILHLTQDGIKLIFDSMSQRLKLIHIVNMKLVRLTYGNRIFNAPDKPPTRLCIDEAFGATHPEDFCQDEQEYLLTFPGLAFKFPGEPKGSGTGQQLRVSSLLLYSGKKPDSAKVPTLPLSPGSYHLDTLTIVREQNFTKGVKISLIMEAGGRHNSNPQTVNRYIPFGASCQSVLSSIGAPNRVFYKSEDKMKIHNAKKSKGGVKQSDYFFNYFNLGLDILFDAISHSIKKFVMHTNFPGHYNFNMYQRCNFELPLTLKVQTNAREAAQLIDLPEVVTIGPSSKWSSISRRLATRGPPVVLRKTSSSSGGVCGGNTAPTSNVHLTNCYNHQDVIIEVMGNDHIAAITLFRSPPDAA